MGNNININDRNKLFPAGDDLTDDFFLKSSQ